MMQDPFARIQPDLKDAIAAEVPDVIPQSLAERLLAAIERQYGPLPPAPPVTGLSIRAGCRFCRGRGCLNCDTLMDAEYQRQFPQGPRPLASFRRDVPQEMQALKAFIQQLLKRLEAEEDPHGQ